MPCSGMYIRSYVSLYDIVFLFHVLFVSYVCVYRGVLVLRGRRVPCMFVVLAFVSLFVVSSFFFCTCR